MAEKLIVTGARGPSMAELARMTGSFGAEPTDSDLDVLNKFADYAITQNAGFQSAIPGPSNNTRLNLAALKAAAIGDKTSLYDGSLWTWTPGNYTGQADDVNIVKADSTALSAGAWVRQGAQTIPFRGPASDDKTIGIATLLQTAVDVRRFGAKCDGVTDDTAAVQKALDYCTAGTQAADPYSSANLTAAALAKTLLIPGQCRITSQLIIRQRKVDRTNGYFHIVGLGTGAGFSVDGNFVLFGTDIVDPTYPAAEFLSFERILFWSANSSNTASCFDPRWLRMRFRDCEWWQVPCLIGDRYAQEWLFDGCIARAMPIGRPFFKAAGAYVIRLQFCKMQNNGGKIFDLFDPVGNSGVVGCAFRDSAIESNNDVFVRAGSCQGLIVSGLYTEGNQQAIVDLRCLPGGRNSGVSIVGNELHASPGNQTSASFYNIIWGPGGGSSSGNTSKGNLHDNALRVVTGTPNTIAGCSEQDLQADDRLATASKMYATEIGTQNGLIPDPSASYAGTLITARVAVVTPVNGVEAHTCSLPYPLKGMRETVISTGANAPFTLSPQRNPTDGARFNNAAVNGQISFPANTIRDFYCVVDGQWLF